MIPSKTHSFLHCLGFNLQRTQGSVNLHAQCSTHQPEMVLDNNTNTRSSLSLKNCIVNIDFKLGLLRRNPSNVGLKSLDLNTMVCHLKLLQKPQHPANNTRSRFARPLLPESHFYWTKCPKPQKIAEPTPESTTISHSEHTRSICWAAATSRYNARRTPWAVRSSFLPDEYHTEIGVLHGKHYPVNRLKECRSKSIYQQAVMD